MSKAKLWKLSNKYRWIYFRLRSQEVFLKEDIKHVDYER